jgi:hypothetical protein
MFTGVVDRGRCVVGDYTVEIIRDGQKSQSIALIFSARISSGLIVASRLEYIYWDYVPYIPNIQQPSESEKGRRYAGLARP